MTFSTDAGRGARVGSRPAFSPFAFAVAGWLLLLAAGSSPAGVIFNFSDNALGGGSRWDAGPRTVNSANGPLERSLQGGLRYSLQGGSFQSFRDMFSWNVLPTVAQFQQAVADAFNAWASVDPVTGLGTALSFVADLNTAVVGANFGNGGTSALGAEIDLFASNDAFFWNVGNTGLQAETGFLTVASPVTLTSGTASYAGSTAIIGADIIINNNVGAVYSLDVFRRLLTHEIGHTLGLGDVEGDISPGRFIDDNLNLSTSASAQATLTNSWANLVNPLNPAASAGLSRFTASYADPGVLTSGVDILMESRGLGISPANPLSNLVPLTNDDYGTRQFLYPFIAQASPAVPEPSTWAAATIGTLLAAALGRRGRA